MMASLENKELPGILVPQQVITPVGKMHSIYVEDNSIIEFFSPSGGDKKPKPGVNLGGNRAMLGSDETVCFGHVRERELAIMVSFLEYFYWWCHSYILL